MNKRSRGFVVSAVLYPLLVLFLALIMGLLAMTDTRKRILDKMKLEISDSIFDEATCSCDTILNKLNYIIKNGVSGGGGGGSYTYNVLGLNVKTYETPADLPNVGNGIGDIAVISDVEMENYYVSQAAPASPKEGTIWIVQDKTSNYHITSDYSNIGISYVMQYVNSKWELKKSYVYDEAKWTLLYYVPLKDGIVDITGTDINAEIEKKYSYTGDVQTFTARFSGYYQVELWGSQGANGGGYGAYTKGEIYLNAGEILYLYVGGNKGTFNGSNGSGGGATDIRVIRGDSWNNFDSLKSRIMVAAGGNAYTTWGGNSRTGTAYLSGAGGGLVGYTGDTRYSSNWTGSYSGGTGGTQSAGGVVTGNTNNGTNGGFGYAGRQSYDNAGGSGWYGGSGGGNATNIVSNGGGGSSYISGHAGCNAIAEMSTSNYIIHTGSSYSFTGKYFINTQMIDGQGYEWTTYRREKINMPTHDGKSMMVGNSGEGYAKITLSTVEIISDVEIKETMIKNENLRVYDYSGIYQLFEVNKSGNYKLELWGSQGSNGGGYGGYVSGNINLSKGTKLYVFVGGNTGSFNGSNGVGGGSTDIRVQLGTSPIDWNDITSLSSRILVAAGGNSYTSWTGANRTGVAYLSGAGGGLIGYNGDTRYNAEWTGSYRDGTGGTQTAGGIVTGNTSNGTNGGFGYAGNHAHAASGGSGWYGGSGGGNATNIVSNGGGGSSYISGHAGCIAVNKSGQSVAASYTKETDSHSWTQYIFTNTKMIDGQGYSWTTTRSNNKCNMPSKEGPDLVTGNSGLGRAKITYLGE